MGNYGECRYRVTYRNGNKVTYKSRGYNFAAKLKQNTNVVRFYQDCASTGKHLQTWGNN